MEENKEKEKIYYIPIEDIIPNRFQPRLAFDEKELNELANSIIKYGVIQPIVLRNIGDKYEIIAGERRYKASCLAGLKKVPAIINNTDDNTSAEIALLENLQRKNLSVIEEAQSYKKLMDRGFTQEEIASKLGVSQSSIANKMRLLNLPKDVQNALLYNKISERHARSLLSLPDADMQRNLLNKIISEKLTVKQTEEEISAILNRNKEQEPLPEDIQRFLKIEPKTESKEALLGDKQVEEYLDIKVPEVVTIEPEAKATMTEYTDNTEIINPFQQTNGSNVNVMPTSFDKEAYSYAIDNSKDLSPVVEESSVPNTSTSVVNPTNNIQNNSVNNVSVNTPNTIQYEEEPEEVEKIDKDSLLEEDGSVNLPNVINKVRDFINSLDEVSDLITTSELDLTDTYQIIIEIDKNSH
ncbi:parB-like partition protein [Clostridium sp. CAG:524]|nr:parB-like partition protein [Clostridium sp. CAG:524]